VTAADSSDWSAIVPDGVASRQRILLVFHGSRDPQYQPAVDRLLQQVRDRLACAVGPVAGCQAAMLECSDAPLSAQILDWLAMAGAGLGSGSGSEPSPSEPSPSELSPSEQLLPMFLLPGVHVREDIPAQIALVRQQAAVTLIEQPYLGAHPALLPAIRQYVDRLRPWPDQALIVISHGSRRSGGNQPVETLAADLTARVAYWSVEPSLAVTVQDLYDRGRRYIRVLPYILLTGSLTQGIESQIAAIAAQFPDLTIEVLPALDQSGILVDLVMQILVSD
jgi:sirohydrochlorin cobaltochelatase